MTERQEQLIGAALEKMFRNYNTAGPRNKDQRTHDFVFHMTDWYTDLMRLARLYATPEAFDQKTWNQDVFGFLVHAVAHLMAAARLSDTFHDTFGACTPAKRRVPKKRTTSAAAR